MVLRTVQKIGPVLDLFTVDRPEWGVSEVADELAMPRSSAHALMSSLVDTGLLQARGRGRYKIGWRVVELNETMRNSIDVRSLAVNTLQNLVKTHRETAHLAVMENGKVLYVEKIIGTHNLIVRGAHVGTQLRVHCSAVGKVLLAAQQPSDRHAVFVNKLTRYTGSTIVEPAALREELNKVRTRGFALDRGEAFPEVHCVAAPVRDEHGSVIAAIGVTVPILRFAQRQPELTAVVRAAAGEISGLVAAHANAVGSP